MRGTKERVEKPQHLLNDLVQLCDKEFIKIAIKIILAYHNGLKKNIIKVLLIK